MQCARLQSSGLIQPPVARIVTGMQSEYDFKHETTMPDVKMELKPNCSLRPYQVRQPRRTRNVSPRRLQEKSLRKMFANGRARSGIIVLPCGAGKTLTGVTAACTLKKRTIVLCTSGLTVSHSSAQHMPPGVAVEQWRSEFKRWCDMDDRIITRFTSDSPDEPVLNGIIICTCAGSAMQPALMRLPQLLHAGVPGQAVAQGTTHDRLHRAARVGPHDSRRGADRARQGRLLLVAALPRVHIWAQFRLVLTKAPVKCKLGLTATLVREDGLIADLRFLIGPKLYEANWMHLQACAPTRTLH